MAYIEWWNRTGPITMGERFGLNEISTARKTLSPIKSHTAKEGWWSGTQGSYGAPEELSPMPNIPDLLREEGIEVGEQVKDGGRIDMKPGGIVEPGVVHYGKKDKMTLVDLKKEGIKSKTRYYVPSKDKYALTTKVLDENARDTGKYKTELFDSVKEREAFAKKRLEMQQKVVKDLQQKSVKVQAKIDKSMNNWTKNWFEKNTKNFRVGDYDNAIAKLAEDWAVESKKAIYQQKLKIFKRSLTTDGGLPVLRDAKIFGMSSADMVKSGQFKPGAQERIIDTAQSYYKRVFHSGLLKNSKLRNNVKDFMSWAAKDKTGSGGTQLLAQASDWLTEDTIKLMGELDTSVLPHKSRGEILRYYFPKTADLYLKRVNMMNDIRKVTESAVEKLAGVPKNYIKNSLEADRRKLRKIFNTDKLPLVLRYSGDHFLGLREAQILGDKKFAKQAVDNLIGRTFAQNSELGGRSFGNQRRDLTKEFANSKTTSARKAKIVERLNILSDEFIPGEVEYKLGAKNNLIVKPLKIQTQPERFASYFKDIAETKEGSAEIKKQYGNLENLLKKVTDGIKILPYEEQVKIAKANNCPIPIKGKAEGGRIGFGAGSGSMVACIDAKFRDNPKGFWKRTANIGSKGLDQLWKYAAPYWFPPVIAATGRLEAFKHPTEPQMWWDIMLASDAVKRWGLDKVTLSQLKNASWLKRADIIGKLLLKFPGDKILTQAAKVAKPLIVATETLSAVKGIKTELDLVKEYALKNNIPYEDAKLAYYASAAALEPRWEGDKSFKSWASSKLIGGSTVYATAWQKRNDPEFQQIGKNVFQYIKENKPEPVEEEVTEKVEIPSGLDWALNMKAQMKEKEPPKYAAVDSYFMGGIASLIK